MINTSNWLSQNLKIAATKKQLFNCIIEKDGYKLFEGYTYAASEDKACTNAWWRASSKKRIRFEKLKQQGFVCRCELDSKEKQETNHKNIQSKRPNKPEQLTLFDNSWSE